jgi:hypothetical protein
MFYERRRVLIAGLRVGEKVRTFLSIAAYVPLGSPQEFEDGEFKHLIWSTAFKLGRARFLSGDTNYDRRFVVGNLDFEDRCDLLEPAVHVRSDQE